MNETENTDEKENGETAEKVVASELAQVQAKAEEYLDLARRTKADFLNYQDRMRREREQMSKYALESFVREILPALESLRRSLLNLREATDPKAVLDGVALVDKEFARILAKNGVVPIETSGKSFDPLYHEAVGTVPTADLPENTIVEEVHRGWVLNDRVLRPAGVRVAVAPKKEEPGPSTS